MFRHFVMFGQICDEPGYGKNASLVQGFATGPDDVELAGGAFLPVPGAIAPEVHRGGPAGCSRNHSVRAAAITRRHVWAPTMRRSCRHWS
jgi:hypothetical protein